VKRRPNARNDRGEGVMAVHKDTDANMQFARTLTCGYDPPASISREHSHTDRASGICACPLRRGYGQPTSGFRPLVDTGT
jgi:hypothetical protein